MKFYTGNLLLRTFFLYPSFFFNQRPLTLRNPKFCFKYIERIRKILFSIFFLYAFHFHLCLLTFYVFVLKIKSLSIVLTDCSYSFKRKSSFFLAQLAKNTLYSNDYFYLQMMYHSFCFCLKETLLMVIIHQQCTDRIYFCLYLENGVSFPIRKTINIYQGINLFSEI